MYRNIRTFLSRHRLLGIVTALAVGFTLVACGGGQQKKKDQPAEPTGSLKRTYTIVDEQGRKSGTLTLDPLGGAELRDVDGEVIGKFKSAAPAQDQPAAVPSEAQPKEEPAEVQPKE